MTRLHDGGANWSTIAATLPANSQGYSDSGLAAETTYHYRVRAFNEVGDSQDSNTASATTWQPPAPVPQTPTDFNATNAGSGSADLVWVDVADEDTYELQREKAHKQRADTWTSTTRLSVVAGTTSFNDPVGSGTFRYRIRAANGSGASDWSTWKEVTVTDSGGGGGDKCHPKRGC